MTLVKESLDVVEELRLSDLDRRRGLRITQERPIKVFEPTTARYFPGHTADISATGLRVEVPLSTPVRPGKTVSVHVGLNSIGNALANRREMIPARIVWIDRCFDRKTTMLGLEFITSITAQRDAA